MRDKQLIIAMRSDQFCYFKIRNQEIIQLCLISFFYPSVHKVLWEPYLRKYRSFQVFILTFFLPKSIAPCWQVGEIFFFPPRRFSSFLAQNFHRLSDVLCNLLFECQYCGEVEQSKLSSQTFQAFPFLQTFVT